MKNIKIVFLHVTLMYGEAPQSFTFSRFCTPPRTVIRLSPGSLDLTNIKYLVADAEIATEELLIGLSLSIHLGVDTKELLEPQRDVLDEANCSAVQLGTDIGPVSHIMISRFNRVKDDPSKTCQKKLQVHELESIFFVQG